MLNYIKIKFNIVKLGGNGPQQKHWKKRQISIHQKEWTIITCLNFSMLKALLSTFITNILI